MPPPSNTASRRGLLPAVATGLFCVQLDYFAVNLALPRMADELGSTVSDLQWVISVYMVTLGAFMVPAGRIGDIFGRKRALLTGVALFGIASALCALAPSAPVVIAMRVVQGLGAALIFPVSVSVLTNALPPDRASRTIGLAYGIAGLGNAAGPLVGGLLTETLGWRWIFWINVPLTILAFVLVAVSVTESSDESAPRRIDLTGLALITTGIGLFTLTFDRAPTWGWVGPLTITAFLGSVILLTAFVIVERRTRLPLVNLALLRDARFSVLIVAGTIGNVAYGVTIFLSTLNLQQVRGLDPFTAGLAFLGPSIGAALGGVLSGRLAEKRSPTRVLGATIALAGLAVAALAADIGWVGYIAALTACCFTLGLGYAFTTIATQAAVPPERAGEAAGITLTVLVAMGGVGVATSSTVLEMLQRSGTSTGAAIDAILAGLAVLLVLAGVVVLAGASEATG